MDGGGHKDQYNRNGCSAPPAAIHCSYRPCSIWAELLLRSVGRVAGACDAINKRIIYRGEKVMLQPNKLMVMKSGEKPLLGSILQLLADRSIKKRNSIRNPFFF